jgi:hypothetical protein
MFPGETQFLRTFQAYKIGELGLKESWNVAPTQQEQYGDCNRKHPPRPEYEQECDGSRAAAGQREGPSAGQ